MGVSNPRDDRDERNRGVDGRFQPLETPIYNRNPYWNLFLHNATDPLQATVLLLVTLSFPSHVSARGRMMEPPQRSSLFSRGFNSPVNDDDSALNCGGAWRQHELNGGKCGVCGDPYDAAVRENEPGGKYANGIIANTYTTNDTSILVVIDIQSFLKGYFEFRICPHNNVEVSVEQSCLDRYPLTVWDLVDSQPRHQYYPKGVGLHRLRVELPTGMTCTQCVLQWKWHTGTNWGRCPNGLYMTGCGPQEEYYNCADIAIVPASDQEYKHFLPEVPGVQPETLNNGLSAPSELSLAPWASVSFVSHDSRTVVNLKNSTSGAELPIVNEYDPEPGPTQNIPVSFLPKEATEVRPEEPVQPKFDFYDPSKTTTVVAEVKLPETRTEPIVPVKILNQITTLETLSSTKSKKDVVVLPYNGVSSDTIADSTVTDVTTESNTVVNTKSQESSTNLRELITDIATESIFLGSNNTTLNGISTTAFDDAAQPKPTVPSIAVSSTDGTTKQASTRNFDIRTFTGINATTPNLAEFSGASTLGMTGSSESGNLGLPAETTTISFADTTDALETTTRVTIIQHQSTETPIRLPSKEDSSTKMLLRKIRQAGPRGPPPPPPPEGAIGTGPIDQPPRPDPSPSAMYDPAMSAPTLAQKEVIIQQQYSSGNTMAEASSIRAQGTEMMGVEALGEPGVASGMQGGSGALHAYPLNPDQYNPTQSGPGPDSQVLPQDRTGQTDPGMGGPDPDPMADAGVPYEPPRIPRPPEVSASEIEKAIADTPVISSAVSDTGKPMDASSILGTTYIAGLNEAASNLAETSTASRQGTMIVHAELSSPADRGKKGGNVEYLSPTQGTSVSDKPSETVAQVPDTIYSSSLGFMLTPEQIMSGMRGITRPVPADTTNLEPTGPAPPDPNAQNVMEAKEALIRQLGEAMGIISVDTKQPVPANPPAQTANIVPDQNIATILAMAGAGSQTSAGPIAMTAEAMATNQMEQPVDQAITVARGQMEYPSQGMVSDMSQSQSIQQSTSEQAMFAQSGDQGTVAASESEAGSMIPGLMGRPAGQLGSMSNKMMQLFARMQAAKMNPAMLMAGLNQPGMQMALNPSMAALFANMAGMNAGAGAGMSTTSESAAVDAEIQLEPRTPMEPDMMIPGSETPIPAQRITFGQDTMQAPAIESAVQQEQTLTSAYTEPMTPQNTKAAKAVDLSTSGADMIMDKAMMQNLMRMRLSPEMVNYIKLGASGVDTSGAGADLGVHKSLIKRNTGMQPAPTDQHAMMSATSQAAKESIIDGQITNAQQHSMSAEQQTTDTTSQQRQRAFETAPVSAAEQPPDRKPDLLMTMGRLFGGNAGLIGGGLMGGASQADMSWVKYETANKGVGQADLSANQVGSSRPETTNLQADPAATTPITEQSPVEQGTMFTGLENQLMGTFGLGGLNQGADQGAVMSEVVSGSTGMASGEITVESSASIQSLGDASSQVSQSDQATQAATENQGSADFTPIGSVGSWDALSGTSTSITDKPDRQWSWDPMQQAWILISAQDPQGATDVAATSVGQTQLDTIASQDTGVQSIVDQQAVTADASGVSPQATDMSQGQLNVDAGSQTVDRSAHLAWIQAGYQWDAATNSYIPVQTTVDSQTQAGFDASQATDAQNAVDITATQAATSDANTALQQVDTVGQAAQEPVSIDTGSQTTSQGGQSWEQAGYTWDPSTNAYVPTATLQQSMNGASQAVGTSEAVLAVDSSSTVDAAADMSVVESGQISSSSQMTVEEGTQTLPIVSQQTQGIQLQPTVYVPNQGIDQAMQEVAQQGQDVQPTIYQPSSQQQASDQQQAAQTSFSEQQAMQQVDYTQWSRQQMAAQGQQTGAMSVQGNVDQQQDSGFQAAQQALSADARSHGFQETPQTSGSVRGPLMAEAQQWEQVASQQQQAGMLGETAQQWDAASNKMSQQQQLQQQQQPMDTTGVESMDQASQQQALMAGQVQTTQQQPGQEQMTQYAQQQWQAAQTVGGQVPQYQATQGQVDQTVTGSESQQWSKQVAGSQTDQSAEQTWSQSAQGDTSGAQADVSFTPMGETGLGSDATARAWQALLVAAQSESQKTAGTSGQTQAAAPIVPAHAGAQQTGAQQDAAQQTISWEEIVKAAMTYQATAPQQTKAAQSQQQDKLQIPAWATGLQSQQSSGNEQAAQQQQAQEKQAPQTQTVQAPQKQTGTEKRQIPIRPDPVTRAFVRDMFVKQMAQGPDVNPLHILIGLNPELLMKSGVNPRIAKSGDVSQIVPAVERALGISLRRRRGRGRRPGGEASIGGAFADPMGGLSGGMDVGGMGPEPGRRGPRPVSARDRAMQRRKFMMEQRMITEVMGMLGLGPEPLEPGDPGYRPPGRGRGGAPGGVGPSMGGAMMDPAGGGMGMGMGMSGGAGAGAGGAANSQGRMMMELLGF